MSTIFEKAAGGNTAAIWQLIGTVEKQTQALCNACVDETQSRAIIKLALENNLRGIMAERILKEETFRAFVLRDTADLIRRSLQKGNAPALRSPKNGSFLITLSESTSTESLSFSDFLSEMPLLNRFIFALDKIAGLGKKEIAQILNFKTEQITQALKDQEKNIALILEAHKEASFDLDKELNTYIENSEFSPALKEELNGVISQVIKDFKPKAKVILAMVIAAAVVAVIAVFLAFNLSGARKTSTGTTSSSASSKGSSTSSASSSLDSGSKEKSKTESSSASSVGTASTSSESSTTSSASKTSQYRYIANIFIKDYGTITLGLDEKAAPITVQNFVNLAGQGFYNGLTFHRIMKDFMMQGGDPKGDGTGGSSETIKGEFKENGVENNISHVRGVVSMARSSDKDSASSQFFIVQKDSTFLDGQYAAFGYVLKGIDVVDKICDSAKPTDDNGTIPKDKQPVITAITIEDTKGE